MSKYVKLTLKEFEWMRQEIESSYSQSGCMDEDAAKVANNAHKALKMAERRNGIKSVFGDE